MNDNWLMELNDPERNLYVTRHKPNPSGAFSPCNMSPDDVDYEMSFKKSKIMLQICGMNQESLEYFAEKYGETYEYLSFFKCQLISDFSPLSNLKNLKAVHIYWNIRSDKLWNMKNNISLEHLSICSCKKITRNLNLLSTGDSLKRVLVYGTMDDRYPIESLGVFEGMPALECIELSDIKILDKNTSFIKTLPNLQEFHFDAGMFTTEEIAYMCAKYPHLHGKSLCPYNKTDAFLNDVRICGYRKPGLDLPQGQKRLDKYIAEFNALVEKFKTED